jgi:hypothetical protein
VLFTKFMIQLRLLLSFLLFAVAAPVLASPARPRPPVVVAYVFPGDTLSQPEQIDAVSLTRINYAFANIVDGRVPSAKILLGVRCYGRARAYVSALSNGLFQPGQLQAAVNHALHRIPAAYQEEQ